MTTINIVLVICAFALLFIAFRLKYKSMKAELTEASNDLLEKLMKSTKLNADLKETITNLKKELDSKCKSCEKDVTTETETVVKKTAKKVKK